MNRAWLRVVILAGIVGLIVTWWLLLTRHEMLALVAVLVSLAVVAPTFVQAVRAYRRGELGGRR